MGATPGSKGSRRADDPDHVLEHRAVLSTPDGEPFSEVVETYTQRGASLPAAAENDAGTASRKLWPEAVRHCAVIERRKLQG
jgi:hypothetical protein